MWLIIAMNIIFLIFGIIFVLLGIFIDCPSVDKFVGGLKSKSKRISVTKSKPRNRPRGVRVTKLDPIQKRSNKENKPYLVLFKADWCGPCQLFTPIWETLENSIPKDNMIIFKDHHSETQMCGINLFPTIYLYLPNKERIKFSDKRSQENVLKFWNKHTKEYFE